MSTSKRVKVMLKVNPTATSICTQCSSTSASFLANNADRLMQILLLLPIESLLKFKCVSKHWYSLISNPEFTQLRTPFPNSPSGLFLRTISSLDNTPCYSFIHFSPNPNKTLSCVVPFEYLAFAEDPSRIRILQSCNGLFLCSSSLCNPRKAHYYRYNPTTSQHSKLPPPGINKGHDIVGVSLAFDPSNSPQYKVVCVSRKWNRSCSDFTYSSHSYQIEIYTSNKGPWRVSSCGSFTASDGTKFHREVFCNGAIHWFSRLGSSLCFNVDKEQVRHVPLLPKPDNRGERRIGYFAVCKDHLHLIEIYGPRTLMFMKWQGTTLVGLLSTMLILMQFLSHFQR